MRNLTAKSKIPQYGAVHTWLKYHYGKADHCEHCDRKEGKRFEWANISGEYRRDRSDFIQLCNPCHKIYDNLTKKNWNTRKAIYGPSGRSKDKFNVLSSEQVIEIRNRLKKLELHASIAKDYDVHPQTICNISLGKSWRHLVTDEELADSMSKRRTVQKYSDEFVLKILAMVEEGQSCRQIGRILNISHQLVSDYKNGKRRAKITT